MVIPRSKAAASNQSGTSSSDVTTLVAASTIHSLFHPGRRSRGVIALERSGSSATSQAHLSCEDRYTTMPPKRNPP